MISDKTLAIVFCAFIAAPMVADAQIPAPGRSSTATIVSSPSGAEVYRGDSLLGRTPMSLPRDTRDTLVLYMPSRGAWRKSRAVAIPPFPGSDEGVVRVMLEAWMRVSSTPSGAAVFAADTLAGYTPLEVNTRSLPMHVTLRRPGWTDTTLALEESNGDDFHVLLSPSGEAAIPDVVADPSGLRMPSSRILVASGIAFTAGVAAVFLKQQADRTYEQYLETRERSALDRTRRGDVAAGVCLALMEISAGYLVYLLLNGL